MASEFITRVERDKDEPYTVIFHTDDADKYKHIEDECRRMIGHAKPTEQQTVDAVPVVHSHSAWKHEIEDMGIFRQHTVRCLNCKCGFTHAYVVLLCGDTGDLFMHCPNCGAKMKV